MSQYKPTLTTQDVDPYIQSELVKISKSFIEPTEFLCLGMTYVVPKKYKEGDIYLADGTHWNPGSGAGVYCYYAGSWKKLG